MDYRESPGVRTSAVTPISQPGNFPNDHRRAGVLRAMQTGIPVEERLVKTRGETMLELRKARMEAAPAFLRGGFRPFFLLAAAWAAFAILTWLCAFLYGVPLASGFAPLAWHR